MCQSHNLKKVKLKNTKDSDIVCLFDQLFMLKMLTFQKVNTFRGMLFLKVLNNFEPVYLGSLIYVKLPGPGNGGAHL